jgi:hypothetical protein
VDRAVRNRGGGNPLDEIRTAIRQLLSKYGLRDGFVSNRNYVVDTRNWN